LTAWHPVADLVHQNSCLPETRGCKSISR
jgi:hypothetical protein